MGIIIEKIIAFTDRKKIDGPGEKTLGS